jgi:hypothetical protein
MIRSVANKDDMTRNGRMVYQQLCMIQWRLVSPLLQQVLIVIVALLSLLIVPMHTISVRMVHQKMH